MKVQKIQLYNRAPFENMVLDFNSTISVLSGINGVGKTTILSYIVDAMYEMAKEGFQNEFMQTNNKFYRVSSGLNVLNKQLPSFVYIRFSDEGKMVDYIDMRNCTTKEQYAAAVQINDPIEFSTIKENFGKSTVIKFFDQLEDENAKKYFSNNIMTYFPAYRYEQPAYLTDAYHIELQFNTGSGYSGYLVNPIEVTSNLKSLTNWMMDIVLDMSIYKGAAQTQLDQLNQMFSALLNSKIGDSIRLGIGPRNSGGTRIQVVRQSDASQVYPSIFEMSSGEHALICLFGELIRQADNIGKTINTVSGIVLVDEIDKHLHIKLQRDTLPSLIKMFPNVQFIVSSHSPFFNLGLADKSENSYKIYDLDNGGIVCAPCDNPLFQEVYQIMLTENERYAHKYHALRTELSKSRIPLIITEGKSDWKHLKAAIKALNIMDLGLEIYEYNETMGDETLMRLLKQFAMTSPGRKIIGMFDRDNDCILQQTCKENSHYVELSKNIFAFSVPVVNEEVYGPHTSIEHYYAKNDLLSKTVEGRRLFLGSEFYESGIGKCSKYQTRAKNIQNKVRINGIIDEKVYAVEDDPEMKNSIALSKDDFAELILSQDDFAKDFDFTKFDAIISIIREIINLK